MGTDFDSRVESLGSLAAIFSSCQRAISETDDTLELESVRGSRWTELSMLPSGQAWALLRQSWRRIGYVVLTLSESVAKVMEVYSESEALRSLRVNRATYSALLNGTQKDAL